MRKLLAAAAVIAATWTSTLHAAGAAEPFTLVTKDDVAAEQLFEAKPNNDAQHSADRALSLPPNPAALPSILILSPQPSDAAIASPVRIELAFKTSADAHVIPGSFKVMYGLLKIDITDKLRPYATVTETGLVADNAALPTGNHRLFLQISDSAGRTGVRELKFTVEK